jgi:tetratricopeptide (TPR) repeat protein
MMADAERALGRFDRALALVDDEAARDASRATQIELAIVASGIRRDQGSPAAGVALLQVPELTDGRLRPWSARLFYAYADALLDAGREDEAHHWFGRAAAADADEETDAAERYEELDPVLIEDLAEPADEEPAPADEEPGREDVQPEAADEHPGPAGVRPESADEEPAPAAELPGPEGREPLPADAESRPEDTEPPSVHRQPGSRES